MSDTTAGALQLALLVAALVAAYRPLGDHMYRTFTSESDLRAERFVYRLAGIDPRADQRWGVYARSLLMFSAASVLLLYGILRIQAVLPWALGMPGVPAVGAWNTAVSFVTNTNWQWYSGESTMGYFAQMAGLAVQNFVSAAVGLAVAVALIRGFTRQHTDRVGNFWVDMTRAVVRVLLPLSILAAVVLMVGGVVQNFAGPYEVTTLAGGTQTITGGPGGQPGGDQGARHERRRLLQRQLRAPVREPERVDQPVRDLPAAGDPVRPAPHLRPDGRQHPPGPGGRLGDGRAVAGGRR